MMKYLELRVLLLALFVFGIYCEDKSEDVGVSNDDAEDTVADEDELTVKQAGKPTFVAPQMPEKAYFCQFFQSTTSLKDDFVLSETKKDGVDDKIAKYDGKWAIEVPSSAAILEDFALVLKSQARHAALSSILARPFSFAKAQQFVAQYEVKFQNAHDCGGAYLKFISASDPAPLTAFHDKTPYSVMFGPDKCGNDHKLHFIIRHKNPKSGEFEEKHAKKPTAEMDKYFSDKKTHLYTLVINADNTWEIYVDQKLINSGGLLTDLEPPINPPEEVDDPNDKKPDDWDERAKIVDEKATKPDDWDETEPAKIPDEAATKPEGWLDNEPSLIPDAKAVKPADWDAEMDGEYEAPKIENPRCKEAPDRKSVV